MIDSRELREIAERESYPSLSFYIPTHPAGPEIQQDRIRLKNLIASAERRLSEIQISERERDTLLRPAKKLVIDEAFWRNQTLGLALLISQESFYHFHLSFSVTERLTIGKRFQLKPLLAATALNQGYFVLAINRNRADLYRHESGALRLLESPELPHGVEEILQYVDYEKHLQFRTQPGGKASDRGNRLIFHGHGGAGSDAEEAQIRAVEFVRKLSEKLTPFLREENLPLIVAASDPMFRLIIQAVDYPNVLEHPILGNPADRTPAQLLNAAKEAIAAAQRARQLEDFKRFTERVGSPYATTDPLIAARAAKAGAVDTLFVHLDESVMVQGLEEMDGNLVVDQQLSPLEADILDYAAVHTFLTGGTVHILQEKRTDEWQQKVSAILRYPLPNSMKMKRQDSAQYREP